MRTVTLTRGKTALVDDEDYELVSGIPWSATNNGRGDRWYAVHRSQRFGNLRMHRLILNAPDHLQIDHVDGNTLDNRRSNLRLATRSQNGANRRLSKNNTSGFTGVTWNKNWQKWEAQIKVRGERLALGGFASPEEAAAVYNRVALAHFGEFARLSNEGGDDGPPT